MEDRRKDMAGYVSVTYRAHFFKFFSFLLSSLFCILFLLNSGSRVYAQDRYRSSFTVNDKTYSRGDYPNISNLNQAQNEKNIMYQIFLETLPQDNYKDFLPLQAKDVFIAKVKIIKPIIKKDFGVGDIDKMRIFLVGSLEFIEIVRGIPPIEMNDYFYKTNFRKNIYDFNYYTNMKSILFPIDTSINKYYYVIMYKNSYYEAEWIDYLNNKYQLSDGVLKLITAAKLFEKIAISEIETIEKKDFLPFCQLKLINVF